MMNVLLMWEEQIEENPDDTIYQRITCDKEKADEYSFSLVPNLKETEQKNQQSMCF